MRSEIKNIVRGTAIVVGVAYAVALHYAGLSFDTWTQRALGFAPVILATLVWMFDVLLWKTPKISKYLGRPKVYGTWLVSLTPRKESLIPPGGNWGPIEAAVVIEQNYWSTSVHLHTAESSSHSTAVAFVKHDQSQQRQRLVYTYANTPMQQHQGRSNPHAGASEFDVIGHDPESMKGTYWTGRLTAGDMTLRKLNTKTDYSNLAEVRAAATELGVGWP
jgi:hypothetical protein